MPHDASARESNRQPLRYQVRERATCLQDTVHSFKLIYYSQDNKKARLSLRGDAGPHGSVLWPKAPTVSTPRRPSHPPSPNWTWQHEDMYMCAGPKNTRKRAMHATRAWPKFLTGPCHGRLLPTLPLALCLIAPLGTEQAEEGLDRTEEKEREHMPPAHDLKMHHAAPPRSVWGGRGRRGKQKSWLAES